MSELIKKEGLLTRNQEREIYYGYAVRHRNVKLVEVNAFFNEVDEYLGTKRLNRQTAQEAHLVFKYLGEVIKSKEPDELATEAEKWTRRLSEYGKGELLNVRVKPARKGSEGTVRIVPDDRPFISVYEFAVLVKNLFDQYDDID